MKNLLTAIKTQLQADLIYVRDSDIFVTEDEILVPEAVRFPAVGLKDGPVSWSVISQGPSKEQTLTVTVIAYVEIIKPEVSIMGDAASGKKGVLEIIDDVRSSLDENTLSGQASNAEVVSESASELLGDEETMIQKKSISFKYERWSA